MSDLLNLKELKEQASIVDLLAQLGFKPVRKYGKEQFYCSMLRNTDSKPSFSVNDDLGVWFDHGTRQGGNIIDFGLAFWKQLSFNQVVEKLQELCALTTAPKQRRPRKAVKVPHYIVEKVRDLGTHPAITDYLKSRGVFEAARSYVSEVYYYVEDEKGLRKHFFAAGWQNETKGWEVRNKYFKGCLGHKAITFLEGHAKNVIVFEGFVNFLSWRVENPGSDESVIVLNSLALLQAGIAKAKLFSRIDLFLDRDDSGLIATRDFLKVLPYASDRSSRYDGFNDYNDKIVAGLSAPQMSKASQNVKMVIG